MKEELMNETTPVETPENELIDAMSEDFFDNVEESGPSLDLDDSSSESFKEEFDLPDFSSENRERAAEGNTSNFDQLFDSLYNDVAGANSLITELIERKKSINNNENLLSELKDKMEQEKNDFNRYVDEQKKALQAEKDQINDYVKTQKIRIQNEEEKFNADCDATRTEISLAKQSLEAEKERFALEKEQFEKYKQLEEEKLKNEKIKLDQGREQFEKERTVSEESIKASQRELETQQEQFEKYKQLEEKKLELGNSNLSQSVARFKELVSQFNSGFSQLPSENK
ncbi:MAG: hypothetical protein HFH08_03080 [Bacilli bacterium]|nr:hypothetical protein [Bacilli bacterium]